MSDTAEMGRRREGSPDVTGETEAAGRRAGRARPGSAGRVRATGLRTSWGAVTSGPGRTACDGQARVGQPEFPSRKVVTLWAGVVRVAVLPRTGGFAVRLRLAVALVW